MCVVCGHTYCSYCNTYLGTVFFADEDLKVEILTSANYSPARVMEYSA